MGSKFKIVLFLTIFFSFFFLTSQKVFALNLFSDDFESNNLSKWQVVNGAWSIITDSQNNHLVVNNDLDHDNEMQAGEFSWTDYIFSSDVYQMISNDANLFFRVTGERSTGLAFAGHDLPVGYGIHISGGLVELQKWTAANGYLLASANGSIVNKISVEVNGPIIKVYTNGSNIPLIAYTDNSSPILSGRIALAMIPGQTSKVGYDNVLVTSIIPPFPSLNVPDIKQYTFPWGGQVYDTATSWSSNPTIARWGCALTTANMVLNFYGFNIDPGGLNTWLKNQSDGYTRSGFLNWLAVSRYSKINKTNNQPSLEFVRSNNFSNQNLVDKLTGGIPIILEEPGHYVVAKSQTQDSFGINDPAFNYQTLASYGNTFNSAGVFTPSNTDLSYIMLAIDPQFDIKVFDISANEIVGNTFLQNSLIDDVDGVSIGGSPLKVFMFPKPPQGSYKIIISGNEIYNLDSYLYDSNGQVTLNNLQGIVGGGNPDNFNITIGSQNGILQNVTFDDLINDWNSLNFKNKSVLSLLMSAKKAAARGDFEEAKEKLEEVLDRSVPKIIRDEIEILLKTLPSGEERED